MKFEEREKIHKRLQEIFNENLLLIEKFGKEYTKILRKYSNGTDIILWNPSKSNLSTSPAHEENSKIKPGSKNILIKLNQFQNQLLTFIPKVA